VHENRTVPGQSGQALVESALTLPLQVFVILGVLQLFLMLQGRLMAEYAVFRAVRAGSVNHGDCTPMTHAAIAALLPVLTRAGSPAEIGAAFGSHRDNRYFEGAHTGQIVELIREQPDPATVPMDEELWFDQPPRRLMRLEVRMLFWFRMRVPFADWVISKILLAHFGIAEYHAVNPLLVTRTDAGWQDGGARFDTQSWPGGSITDNLQAWAGNGQYLFPIEVNATMRMMTPALKQFFPRSACPL
jgi:hypothetical protein